MLVMLLTEDDWKVVLTEKNGSLKVLLHTHDPRSVSVMGLVKRHRLILCVRKVRRKIFIWIS